MRSLRLVVDGSLMMEHSESRGQVALSHGAVDAFLAQLEAHFRRQEPHALVRFLHREAAESEAGVGSRCRRQVSAALGVSDLRALRAR